jgi:hypothetical protein
MFETDADRHEWSWAVFCLQQAVATIGSMLVAACITLGLDGLFSVLPAGVRILTDIFDYALPLMAGFAIGYNVQRLHATAYRTGRWVWILPGSVVLLGMLWDSRFAAPTEVLRTYFYLNSPNGGLSVLLFTYPAFASASYSIGMIMAHRRLGPRASSALPDAWP